MSEVLNGNALLLHRFQTLVDREPQRIFFTYVDDEGRDQAQLDYGTAARRAAGIASYLTGKLRLQRGERVMLVYPTGAEFVVALLGVLQAGLVAVPVMPPDPLRPAAMLPHFAAIAADAGVKHVLTSRLYLAGKRAGEARALVSGLFKRERATWPDLAWHATEGIAGLDPARQAGTDPGPDDLAVLQYTSGSTSFPKGVMLAHGTLAAHIEIMRTGCRFDAESISAAWVPHFHDLGLIGGIVAALSGLTRLYLMSPIGFLERPALWMELCARTRATHTAVPNFAFELAVRKSEAAGRAKLDLSALKAVLNGAEPIRSRSIQVLLEGYGPAGLRAEAVCPVYGLAEATLAVTCWGRGSLHVDRAVLAREGRIVPHAQQIGNLTLEVQACGPPVGNIQLRIVDRETRVPCPPLVVGEIWIDTPSRAQGYYGMPEESAERLDARLADDDGRRYLRSGDLGFIHEGQLYVTGRCKDLIITQGRNHYPQDLERTVEDAHPAFRRNCNAAFAVDGTAGEEIVIVAEVAKGFDPAGAEALLAAARIALAAAAQPAVREIVLVGAGALLKTGSGKIRRGACREQFLAGELVPIASSYLAPATAGPEDAVDWQAQLRGCSETEVVALVEAYLQTQLAGALGVPPSAIPLDEPLAGLGLDSLRITELRHRLDADFGVEVPLEALVGNPTVGELATLVVAGTLVERMVPQAGAAALAARIDDMSDAEVDALLLAMSPDSVR